MSARAPWWCLALAACLPTRSESVSLPLLSVDGETHAQALVDVPLAKLRAQMPGLVVEQLAFYADGNEPVPFQRVPGAGGGAVLRLVVPVRGDGGTRLLAVCPGPAAGALATSAGDLPRAEPAWQLARR